jgi:3-hydroxyisobutyrate dehydrogenase
MSTIAWIGLGHMGTPMAANLVAGGHVVRGVDIDPACAAAAAERGVTIAASIAEALAGADACFTSLPMPAHVRAVYDGPDGIWANADRDTLLLDTSTVDVETSRWCHDESVARGFDFVDSPISGGTAGAEAHSLTFMLGGDEDAVERARALVEPMAGSVIACGGATAGIAAKLVNNMMLFIGVMAVAEGSQLAEQLGLDPQVFWSVADVSSGGSWPQHVWYPVPGVVASAAANRNFDATFSVALAHKDCGLAVRAGDAAGMRLPAASLALSQLDELMAEGLGHKDCTLVTKLVAPDGRLRGYEPEQDTVGAGAPDARPSH